jgi:hypothetical protein
MAVNTSTARAINFSRSIPSSLLQGRRQHLRYLQPKHQRLYGRGVSYVRIDESMSSPPQEHITH